jgi:glycosyltransferase involved in cell wall biosynthesis
MRALVHANDYNTMWIGVAAKLLRRSRLVYDCHELWADRNGRPEWRSWLIACEALFVRFADITITTSPGYAAAIAARYRVTPPVLVRNIPARGAARHRDGSHAVGGRRPLAIYLGGVMPGRGLEQAIEALARVPELDLRMIGPGRDAYRDALARRARAAGVADRVALHQAVAPGEVVAALLDGALGLMLIQPICRSYELTLPNKLFEYAAAGLPILASDLPVIGPLVRAEAIGEVVPAADIELIARAMRRLAGPSVNAEVRERVRAFAQRVTWEQERTVLERAYAARGRL